MRELILDGKEPKWLTNHVRADYVRQVYLSTPSWADRSEMQWLNWCRRAWGEVTGVEHVLCHIVPLNHPHVCGLTVPWNLKLAPRAVNASEGNKWHPEQGGLFIWM